MKFPAKRVIRRHIKNRAKARNLAEIRIRLKEHAQRFGQFSKKSFHRQTAWIQCLKWCLLSLFIIGCIALIFIPAPLNDQLSGMVRVELYCTNRIISQSGDTLYASDLSTKVIDKQLSLSPDSNRVKRYGSGFFVSNGGHVITGTTPPADMTVKRTDSTLRQELREDSLALSRLSQRLKRRHREFDYYARTHSVIDDGYNDVMALREKIIRRHAHTDSVLSRVKRMLESKPNTLSHQLLQRYVVTVFTSIDSGKILVRRYRAKLCHNNGKNLALLQIAGNSLPRHTRRFSIWYFNPQILLPNAEPFAELGFLHTEEDTCTLPDATHANSPKQYFDYTTAFTNHWGQFNGIRGGEKIIDFNSVHHLFFAYHFYINWLVYDIIKWFGHFFDNRHYFQSFTIKGSPTSANNIVGRNKLGDHYQDIVLGQHHYTGRYINHQPNGNGLMTYGDSCYYRGQWKNGQREGQGTLHILNRGTWMGVWHADTLQRGTFHDSTRCYIGQFNRHLQFDGQGILRIYTFIRQKENKCLSVIDSTYYAGSWISGKRTGFGIASELHNPIHAGIWKDDKFLGEQMIYTANRVYGIDISRFQHEIKKKRYSIDWSDLRITSLGSLKRRISGSASYPVSFVYIKATEGKSLRNKYYHADAFQARQHGIAVGAYHFLSTRTPAAEQAAWFLKFANPHSSDLPPMLDVEPSERQIRDMGGVDVLFRAMHTWSRIVEKHTGKRPLLYVGQMFVSRHMPNAPRELQKHNIWIARYSEYKPFVHLQYWQLTPNGRVKGIHGPVDINVFNGTKEEFQNHRKRNKVKVSTDM